MLYVAEEDIFDGIVVQTSDGLRFVEASDVDRIYERRVITSLSPENAQALPAPEGAPAVYDVDPADGIGPSIARPLSPPVQEGRVAAAGLTRAWTQVASFEPDGSGGSLLN